MVKASPSSAGGVGLIPDQGLNPCYNPLLISHGLWPKIRKIKQKQYCNKLNKDFKNGPHKKDLKKKKRTKGLDVVEEQM